MAPFSVVEHRDVVKQVGPGFGAGSIAHAVDALAFEQAKETLHSGVVVAVPRTAHAALNTMPGKLASEVVARILAATVRVVDERSPRLSCVDRHPQGSQNDAPAHPAAH